MPDVLHTLVLMIFPLVVIVAAMRDVTSFTIPNWISLAAAILFAPAALALGLPLNALGVCALVGLAALVMGIAMFALGWIGGGDAKLFAACGLWLGWPAALPFVLWTAIAGGGLAVILLWSRRLVQPAAGASPPWVSRLMTPGGDVPYGLAIAAGALIAFPQSLMMHGTGGLF
jgi:prepilin peptidase CpaA